MLRARHQGLHVGWRERLFTHNTNYEIKLRTKSYIESFKAHDISDIDVLGINFENDLNCFSIGSECKSGETGALDEIYKLIGVSNSLGLDRSYFIKSKIHQNARQVSSQNNIKCYSDAELRKLLSGFDIDIDKEINIEGAKYSKLNNSIKLLGKFNPKIIDYITFEYWNKEDWRNIHNLLHILNFDQSSELFPSEKPINKLVFYYIIELLSISILKTISHSITLNYSDIDSAFRTSLYGGGESLNERKRLFDLVNQVTSETHHFASEWELELTNMANRIAHNTKSASGIPMFLQDIRENSFYDDKINIRSGVIRSYTDVTRKFAQDIIQFVVKNTGINEKIFEDLMKL